MSVIYIQDICITEKNSRDQVALPPLIRQRKVMIQKTQDTLTGLLNLGQLPLKEPVASQLGALCWFFVASHEFGKSYQTRN